MKYIRRIQVESPGTRSEHITAVQHSTSTGGALTTASRQEVVRDIDVRGRSYCSHDDRTGEQAAVETKASFFGFRYLTTVANERETDNLLHLPRF